MDTIIFFYEKKDIERPFIEAILQDNHMLVKVGMDVEPYRFFVQELPQKRPKPEITAYNGKKLEGWDWINPRYFREQGEIRERRRQWKYYEGLIDAVMEKCIMMAGILLSEMIKEVSRFVGGYSDCYCVYDKTVRDVLYGDNPVGKLWQDRWVAEEFTLYTKLPWAGELIPAAANHHFIVLGAAPCIPRLLGQCVDRMKSLRWIMTEEFGREHGEELEEYAESFYQEHGLAVSMEYVPAETGFKKLQFSCREPSNILDFTGEDMVSAGGVAGGSIWLDMGSSEEKCRSLSRYGAQIRYFSLREKWRQTQRKVTVQPPHS